MKLMLLLFILVVLAPAATRVASLQIKNITCLLDHEPVPLGGQRHRLTPKVDKIKAVDTCFIIQATKTMQYRWVQLMAPFIDTILMSRGIGNRTVTGKENRFCLIRYGGRDSAMRAHFIKVNGSIFFSSASAVAARKQLKKHGLVGDAYEALEFATHHTPFRSDPDVRRSFILGSDTGRTVLADKVYLNRPLIASWLREWDITLDVAVNVSMMVAGSKPVLSALSFLSSTIENSGELEESSEEVKVTWSHGSTLRDFVQLALEVGGAVMPLVNLKGTAITNVSLVTTAYVRKQAYLQPWVCSKCTCQMNGSMEGKAVCREPISQVGCRLCANRSQEECSLQLKRAGLDTNGSDLFLQANYTPSANNSATVNFHSNREDVSFKCTQLHKGSTTTTPCRSPILLHGVMEEGFVLVIEGSTQDGLRGIQVLEVPAQMNATPTSPPPLHTDITSVTLDQESLLTTFTFTATSPTPVSFLCSTGSEPYQSCTSPYSIPARSLSPKLTVLSTNGTAVGLASAGLNLFNSTGPLRVVITSDAAIDDSGILSVSFATTREAYCLCLHGPVPKVCSGRYLLNTTLEPPGDSSVLIACTIDGQFTVHKRVHFNIPERYCCPQMRNVSVSGESPSSSTVNVIALLSNGNCSSTMDYSYQVSWGDGGTVIGREPSGSSSVLRVTRTYSTSGPHPITLTYCSASQSPSRKCCKSINMSITTPT